MNSAKIAAAILGIGALSAGVTYYLSSEKSPPAPAPEENADAASPESTAVSINETAPDTPQPDNATPGEGTDLDKAPPPNGIDQASWDRARRNIRMMYGFASQARASEWMSRMAEARVKRDAEAIIEQLGLGEDSASQVTDLLKARTDQNIQQAQKVWDAIMADEARLTEMTAIADMKDKNGKLSPELEAREKELMKATFGEFFDDPENVSEEKVHELFRPRNWYEDDAFLVKAAEEMPGDEGASMVEYAGKLDYLDRERRASRSVNTIQRSVDLSSEQSEQLKQLYIDNSQPSDEQLQQIVPADKVDAVKKATSRRWRGWGR